MFVGFFTFRGHKMSLATTIITKAEALEIYQNPVNEESTPVAKVTEKDEVSVSVIYFPAVKEAKAALAKIKKSKVLGKLSVELESDESALVISSVKNFSQAIIDELRSIASSGGDLEIEIF